MRVASLGYRTDLMLRRMGGAQISDRGSHLVVRTPHQPHYWWGNFFLIRERPRSGEWPGWMAEFAREFPEAAHVAIGLDGGSALVEDSAALAALDLDLLVDTVLSAERLTAPAAPRVAARIRRLAGDEDWARVVRLRMGQDEGPPDPFRAEYTRARVAETRALTEAGDGIWFGAFVDGELACTAGLLSDGSGVARFQNVETHPAWRRNGLAAAVVHELSHCGRGELGAEELVIVADPGYHAIGLYRSLGFRDVEHQVLIQRPPQVEEPD